MNILIVCGAPSGGGAESVARNLASQFRVCDHQVTFFHWRGEPSHGDNKEDIRYVKAKNCSTYHRIFGLLRVLRREKFDVIISFTDIPNILVGLLNRFHLLKDITYIPTVHNDLKTRDDNISFGLKNRIYRYLHKMVLMYSKQIVAVSQGAKKSLSLYYGINNNNISVIYNPVLASVHLEKRIFAAKASIKVLAAGRLVEQKDYYTLLNAMVLAKEKKMLSLDVYGDGYLKSDLVNYVKKKSLDQVVKFKGFTRNLSSIMLEYDVFVLSSRWEGFGNVIVEALDAGLSVISTDCPSGPSEILGGGKYGDLVQVGKPEQIADILLNFDIGSKMDDTKISELRTHLSQFTIANIAGQYLNLIDKVSNAKPREETA